MKHPIFVLVICAGCSSDDSSTIDAATGDVATDAAMSEAASDDAGNVVDAYADAPAKGTCSANPDKVGLTNRTASGNPYVAYVPSSYNPATLMPLVIALHGAGDTALNYLQVIWKGNADQDGFIVIAPEGTAALGSGHTFNISDAALILAAAADIYDCYSIDWKKEILHGFSAGGIMAYLIGLSQSQLFSGISISSSDLATAEYYYGAPLLPSTWPIPFSLSHGSQDQNFPIQTTGIASKNTLEDAGHVVYWHEFDGPHTTTAALAQAMYTDLKSSTAP